MSDPSNTLLARLQRVRQGLPAAEAAPEAAPPAPAAAPGVVPPDAPAREQSAAPAPTAPAEVAAAEPEPTPGLAAKIDAAPAKRRGRPSKADLAARAAAAGPVDPEATPPAVEKPKPAGKAMTCPACGGYAPIDTKERYMDHPGVDMDLKPYPEGLGVCVASGDTPEEARATVAKIRASAAVPAAIGTPQSAAEVRKPAVLKPAPLPPPPPLESVDELVIEAIYIDCLPVKGTHKGAFVMMEDWLAPILKVVAEANNVADYRLISYTSRGVLAEGISAQRQLAPPPVLVVASHASGADVVLENLIPFARTVVRGMRG